MQKIVRVREGEPIYGLDEHTETWYVVKTLGEPAREENQPDWLRYVYVLLERDEEASAEKLAKHQAYLQVVSRLEIPRRKTNEA